MLETVQTVVVDAALGDVWAYVRDIRRWAGLMPGLQDCEVLGEDDSRWTLKVGVGGLVRTVKVQVHVDEWDGPARARFSFKLMGDPVEGGGAYTAQAAGPHATEIALQVQVRGSGPMAPMWEAMGRPLLPQLAKAFADQLKASIEEALGPPAAAPSAPPAPRGLAAFVRRLRHLWRGIFRSEARRASQ
jgi:carbon monoxide dehydrogenase subunit G